MGGGGKGGGAEIHIDYQWVYSLSSIKVIEKPIISFRSFLGNIVFIGDGVTTSFKIANKWEKIITIPGGYAWESKYPENIILYKDSINNRLEEGKDYTYNRQEGIVTFTTPPEKNSLIAMTCTYDSTNSKETTFYASFVFGEIFKRVGFKYYKFKEDYLNTYRKVALMSKSLLDVLWIPMMTGSLDIVYNPLIELGQTIYVKDPKTGFENVVFVKGFNKSLGRSPSLSLEVLNYPTYMEISNFGDTEIGTRFKLQLPTLFVSFIDETNDSNDYYGDVVWFRSEVLDIYDDKFGIFKNPVEISFKLEEKVRTFPSSENNFNKYYPNTLRGILTQVYSCIFRKSPNGEFTDDNDLKKFFPEFYETNPKLFVSKNIVITVKDTKSKAKTALSLPIIFAAKKPFKGYFVPCYPYDPFITFADNREKIYIIDKDKRLWKVDTFLNSSLIDTLDFIDGNTFCIVNCGKEIMIVDDQAKYIRKYNPSTKTYNSYEVNDCLCVKPDTLVYGKGYVKPIKDFKVGEEVLTHTGRYCKINKILTRFYKGNLIKLKLYDKNIATTPEHPVLTTKGWKEAKDIKIGDRIIEMLNEKNCYIREVKDVSKEYYEGLVYNFNVAEDNSYTIVGATVHNCGCNVYLNHKNITDENGFPLFYFRGYSNITDTPYISYVNFIKYKSFSDEMVKTKWSFSINNKVFAGIPFVYGNVVYFGKIGMNLKNAGSYEGNWQWFSEESCSLIVDNCNLVFKNDVPNLNKIKCVYTTDLMENTLYVIGSDCSEATDYILTQPRVIGKEVIFGKRKDKIYDESFDPSTDSTHWEKIAKFTTSDNNDIKSWDIFPITVYGNKILCLVKGSEPSRKIKKFNFGLAVFDLNDKSLHFKIIKYYGESIEGTRAELELTHSVWFKDKVLYNWKDFDYILGLEDIEVIKGE